jgi:hypothetical protein
MTGDKLRNGDQPFYFFFNDANGVEQKAAIIERNVADAIASFVKIHPEVPRLNRIETAEDSTCGGGRGKLVWTADELGGIDLTRRPLPKRKEKVEYPEFDFRCGKGHDVADA